ncbi:ABC transporter substrate-binding protein [Actinokineospora sp. UTMC 2448]|uniref:ABC transporter substrate-binding protein n=1 Tax=Actinokineospora sp. UTMC 2448 TaxID=2268449 RepID=UPI002164A2E4|nr:ABC transporter substrate-binding protein [Actinokineospora sp. UTMC 2448]UVS78106.1 corrinoid ABC transporter substrate-binding protein [Actinokineospora sp. UTMC 2448]
MSARGVALAALALAAATACGTAAPGPQTAPDHVGEGRTAYPLRLDNCGDTYTFTKAPGRVVVMNGGSVAEVSTLLALGLGDRVIANAQSYGASETPGRVEAIAALPTGGVALNNLQDIPREAMLGLRPDLVISTHTGGFAAESGFATRADLRAAGANTYVPPAACADDRAPTIEDSHAMIRDLGAVFDVPGRAEEIIADSTARIAATAAKVRDRPVGQVMIVFPGMGAADLDSVAGNGVWNDILAKAGAVNAFADATRATFASISAEQAAAAEVDALIVVDYLNPDPEATVRALFQRFPQWRAAVDNRFLVLSDSLYFGPDNHLAVERIAGLVHPDVFRQ